MPRLPTACRPAFLILILLAFPLLAACRSGVSMHVQGAFQPTPSGGVDFGKFNDCPRPRLGGLPYPGPFTLFELADPKHLGEHTYNDEPFKTERDRGILYACRGGFIDIAHARKTIDLCKYVAVRAEFALLNDWSAFRVKSLEPSLFTLYLQYPPAWKSLSPDEKKALAHELSIRIAVKTAWIIVNWHEVITWFGYQSTPLASERQSAFTYDDTASHCLGMLVGERALRDSAHPWDQAVTVALNRTLQELGVTTPDNALAAAKKVEGLWWSGFDPLKRHIDLGFNGQPIEPWTVRDLPFCSNAPPFRYQVPSLHNVLGRDFSSLLRIEIQPNIMQTDKIRDILPGKPDKIDVDRDLPAIINHIRNWHTTHDGALSLQPY
jgi:hypothetical protein